MADTAPGTTRGATAPEAARRWSGTGPVSARSVVSLVGDAAQWAAFLSIWRRIHGGRIVTANELCRHAASEDGHLWAGTFPPGRWGGLPNARSLGRTLSARIGEPAGGLVLRSARDAHVHSRYYWVELTGGGPT